MGLFDSLKHFVNSVDAVYDRRIKAASLVKGYDPTGASHHHGQVEVHNEHVEAVEDERSSNGHVTLAEPSQQQQNTPPREVASH